MPDSPDRHIDRRSLLKGAGILGAGIAAGVPMLAACSDGSGAGTSSPGAGGGSTGSAATGGASTSAPTASAGSPGTPVKGGKAVLAIQDSPVNMDPGDGQLYASLQVYQNIFSELLEIDANFKYQPNLASSWQREDDKTWLFDLVENAVFQNGEPVTAKDIAFTAKRTQAHPLGPLVDFIDNVEVLGDHKFRLHLKQAYGPVEATLAAFLPIVNEKAVTENNPKLQPYGSGPYQMVDFVQGSHVTLKRWEKYFKSDRPYFDQVVFNSVSDDTVRLTGLQTGQFDWIQAIPPQRLSEFENSTSIAHTDGKPYFPYLIYLNTTKPPLNDVKVRQALMWAIDRKELVDLTFFASALPAYQPVSPGNPWYVDHDPYQGGPDPDKAKALLKEAGQSSVTIEYLAKVEVPITSTIGEVLQSQFAKIGVNLQITKLSSADYFTKLNGHQYGLAGGYFSVSIDPRMTYLMLGRSTSPFNSSGIKSDRLDAVLDKFTSEPDEEKARQIYPDVLTAFGEEAPYMFIANQLQQYWMKPDIHGSVPYPSLEIRVEDMWRGNA